MKFKMPAGFEPPDNVVPGEPFEVVATVELYEDGTLEITAIDGASLEGESPDSESDMEDTAAPAGGFLESVAGQM